MRTKAEVKHAFTPSAKLSEVQQSALLKTQMLFQNTADELMDLVPDSADRTAGMRKLLEAKMTFTQAITHEVAAPLTTSKKLVNK